MKADIVIPTFGDSGLYRCLRSISEQRLGNHSIASVTVVDDGSDPPVRIRKEDYVLPIYLRRSTINLGRSTARNIGALVGVDHALIFLDADIRLTSPASFRIMLDRLEGIDSVVLGGVVRSHSRFWSWYETRSVARQLDQSGPTWAGTTSFVGIPRTVFDRVGGFDEGFREYGFEDRDLLYRLYSAGVVIQRCREACAEHDGDTQAVRVAEKLHAAGCASAQRFRRKHPDAYWQLPYSRFDFSRANRIIQKATILIYEQARFAAAIAAGFDDYDRLPYWLRGAGVRVLSALAFAAGTAQSRVPAGKRERRE